MTERTRSWITRNATTLSLVGAILLQTCTWVWWASKIDSRIAVVERWQDERRPIVDALPVLREQLNGQSRPLEQILANQKGFDERLWQHMRDERKN